MPMYVYSGLELPHRPRAIIRKRPTRNNQYKRQTSSSENSVVTLAPFLALPLQQDGWDHADPDHKRGRDTYTT
jgi:hypothetical protein